MEIRTLGIVGGGAVGRSIAERCASEGIEVVVAETSDERARAAREDLIAGLDRELKKWGITETDKKVVLSRVRFTGGMEPLREAQIVIEAVLEEVGRKKEVMRRLGEICPPDRTLATSASTLSVTEIAAASGRPDRVVGIRFMHPATTNPIVEIVRGEETSDATLAVAADLARRLDKRAIMLPDRPGGILARAILPLLNEAMEIVREGVASAEETDAALRLGCGLGVGPLEYCDRVGLDRIMGWMDHLHRQTGDPKFRPCPLLGDLVRAGRLGAGAGRGFHAYDSGRRRLPAGSENGS